MLHPIMSEPADAGGKSGSHQVTLWVTDSYYSQGVPWSPVHVGSWPLWPPGSNMPHKPQTKNQDRTQLLIGGVGEEDNREARPIKSPRADTCARVHTTIGGHLVEVSWRGSSILGPPDAKW